MIKYTIFANEGGLACKRTTSKNGPVSYLVTSSEFHDTITAFTSKEYTVKIKNTDVLLLGENEAILLKDYGQIKDNVLLTTLKSHLDATVKEKGFVDVTDKARMSRKPTRSKTKAVVIGLVALGTIIIATKVQGIAPKEEIAIETPKMEYSLQAESSPVVIHSQEEKMIVVEESPVELSASVIEEPSVEAPAENMFVQLDAEPIADISVETPTGYLEFPDESTTDKAITARKLYYPVFEECAHLYGLDAELLLGMATEERGIHSDKKDPEGGLGLMQIQYDVWINKTITYYKLNDATGEYEKKTITVTDELLKDPVWNIHIGSMILQNYLIYDKYNIPQATQSYNQGIGSVDEIVSAYCSVSGKDFKAVRENSEDLGWTEYRYLKNGDPIYLEKVNKWLPNHTFTVTNVFTHEPVTFTFKSTLEMEQRL